ncbi:MAG TPA: universal stress protein [Pirellulaceae bacterium]|nr:universal stress protein [Pirellulaceae bacterium]
MVRSILIGISGTRCSQSAAAYALELAKKHRASLLGVAVVDVSSLCPLESVPLSAGAYKYQRDEAVLTAARQALSQSLVEFTQQATAAGVTSRTMQLDGNPAEVLVAESQRTDLIVVGKRCAPDEDFEQTSGTARAVLYQAARPILCVPQDPAGGNAVLVAYDGSLQSAKTLQLFVASGLAAEREIHLLTIADDAAPIAQRGIEFLHAHDLRVNAHLEAGNHPARQILETASRLNAGLIVMGAYGQPRLREFMFGSVTKAILRESRIPLFLYH